MYLLGVSGKRGVGKNYITENYLIPKFILKYSNEKQQLVPYFFSFGTPVKIELYSRDSTDNLNYSNLFINKTNDTRKLLQNYATENGRNNFRKDMWIRSIDMWIQVHLENLKIVNSYLDKKLVPLFIIEDVRFENEYEYIRNKGGILVLIEAPERNYYRILQENDTLNNHESEKGLEYLDFHLRINNDPQNKSIISNSINKFILQLF